MDINVREYDKDIHYIESSTPGKRWWAWNVIEGLAKYHSRGNSMRFWQAVYNILSELDQEGIGEPWPDLFYEEDFYAGEIKFFAKFDVIDSYLVPFELQLAPVEV
jgi:hypothetical protein